MAPLVAELSSHNEDAQVWWHHLSQPLLSLMQSAGYSTTEQQKYADFSHEFIIPSLGPRPRPSCLPHFDSFCNDDFSPVEFSWNVKAERSTIRIGFEPIGPHSGTTKDPFNQNGPDAVMSRLLSHSSSVDGILWDFFTNRLHVASKHVNAIVEKMAPNEHMTSNTISFDLQGDTVPKVYFYPIAISLLTDTPGGEIMTDVIRGLEIDVNTAFDIVRDFVFRYKKMRSNEMILRLECVSFDAVTPVDSRIKLYLRTRETLMARVEEIYTLGGTLQGDDIEAGLRMIRALWLHVLGVSGPEEHLQRSEHRTAGIIFNFELHHNDPIPRPKVYVPVRHYGGTDLRIAQGLSSFFKWCGWQGLADSYVENIQKALYVC